MVVVAGILVIAILAVILWNRRLSREISERRRIEKELQSSEDRYRSLCNASFEGIVITDGGVIIEANTVVANILGYTIPELIGMEAIEMVAPKVRNDVREKILSGYEKMYESIGLTKQGVEFPIEIHARMFTYQDRQVRCSAIRDLTNQQKARDALRESENKFRAVATGANDAIIMTNGEGKITFWNKAAMRIFQYTEKEMVGKDPHDILSPPSLIEIIKENYPKFRLKGEGNAVGRTTELTALKKDGSQFPIELSLSAIRITGQWCAIAVIREITQRKKLEAQLRRLATTDALTGVDNRRSFMEKANQELKRARRYGSPFSLIMIDIDYFKSVNDHYGHQTGDLVLQIMTRAIRSVLRESDIFGRVGGEEFSIVLIETGQKEAMAIGERIRSQIESLRIDTGKEKISITISMGLTSFRETDDFEAIARRSDKALYKAKENGRNMLISF